MHACMLSLFGNLQLFATLWTVAHQASLSVGFSRQEYWSGLPFPPPGDLSNPRIETASPESPASARRFFTTKEFLPRRFFLRATWETQVLYYLLNERKCQNILTIMPLYLCASAECQSSSRGAPSLFARWETTNTSVARCCHKVLLLGEKLTMGFFCHFCSLKLQPLAKPCSVS